jgi:hypothetical protein
MAAKTRHQMSRVLRSVEPLLPVPWDIDELIARLAETRGRRIELVPWAFPADGPSGLWMPSRRADYIFFADAATPSRREQIIGHELGHLLLDHTPALGAAPDELIRFLAPSVSPELARRVLARTGYDEPREAQAEAFGTALVRAGRAKDPPSPDDELGRLTQALR